MAPHAEVPGHHPHRRAPGRGHGVPGAGHGRRRMLRWWAGFPGCRCTGEPNLPNEARHLSGGYRRSYGRVVRVLPVVSVHVPQTPRSHTWVSGPGPGDIRSGHPGHARHRIHGRGPSGGTGARRSHERARQGESLGPVRPTQRCPVVRECGVVEGSGRPIRVFVNPRCFTWNICGGCLT